MTWIRSRSRFSAGIAIHDGNDLPEQTLYNADQAVLRAKKQGKDQVVLYPRGGWLGEGGRRLGDKPW